MPSGSFSENKCLIQVWFFPFLSREPQTVPPRKKGYCLLFLTYVNLCRAYNMEQTLLKLWENGGRRAVYLTTCKGLETISATPFLKLFVYFFHLFWLVIPSPFFSFLCSLFLFRSQIHQLTNQIKIFLFYVLE